MSVLPEKSSTILLADADAESASNLEALLTSWNYQVQVLANGAAAFQVLNSPEAPGIAFWTMNYPP